MGDSSESEEGCESQRVGAEAGGEIRDSERMGCRDLFPRAEDLRGVLCHRIRLQREG